jgi:hypothetical protein
MKINVVDATTGKTVSDQTLEQIAKDNCLGSTKGIFHLDTDGVLYFRADSGENVQIDTNKYNIIVKAEGKYPDLEYFEQIFLGNIYKSHPEAFEKYLPLVELADAFSQIWPNAAGGFCEPNTVAGQALTTEITTVMRMHVYSTDKDYYAVFFGNKPAYIVEDANDLFFNDLKNHTIKSNYEAKSLY